MNCFLLQLLPVAERLAHDFTDDAISVEGWVEDDRPKFPQIYLPVRQYGFIRLRGHD